MVEKPEYQEWAAKFGNRITHMYVNAAATASAPILLSSRAMQARLNVLNRGLFPLQYMDLLKGEKGMQENLPPGNGVKALPGKNLLKLVLRPANRQGINYGARPLFCPLHITRNVVRLFYVEFYARVEGATWLC